MIKNSNAVVSFAKEIHTDLAKNSENIGWQKSDKWFNLKELASAVNALEDNMVLSANHKDINKLCVSIASRALIISNRCKL